MPICGKTLLERVLEACGDAYERFVLIPDTPRDDELAWFLRQKRIPFLRGPEENTLARYLALLDATGADKMIRVCGDSPFLEPKWIQQAAEHVSPVFVPSALHGGGQEIWRLCGLSLGGVDEHAGHDWFKAHAVNIPLVPDDLIMVNTAEDLARARSRFVTK